MSITQEKSIINVFPNPFTNEININLTNTNLNETILVQIFSINGNLAFEDNLKGETIHTINLNQLASGTYICKLSGQNLNESKVIIKY